MLYVLQALYQDMLAATDLLQIIQNVAQPCM